MSTLGIALALALIAYGRPALAAAKPLSPSGVGSSAAEKDLAVDLERLVSSSQVAEIDKRFWATEPASSETTQLRVDLQGWANAAVSSGPNAAGQSSGLPALLERLSEAASPLADGLSAADRSNLSFVENQVSLLMPKLEDLAAHADAASPITVITCIVASVGIGISGLVSAIQQLIALASALRALFVASSLACFLLLPPPGDVLCEFGTVVLVAVILVLGASYILAAPTGAVFAVLACLNKLGAAPAPVVEPGTAERTAADDFSLRNQQGNAEWFREAALIPTGG